MSNKTLTMLVMACVVIVSAFKCSESYAEVRVTPYLSLGAYHLLKEFTDPLIAENGDISSDTPGTIDFGLRFVPTEPTWWLLYADEVDAGWHHQSWVDRGGFIVYDFGKEEAQTDMLGVRFTWLIESWSFTLGK